MQNVHIAPQVQRCVAVSCTQDGTVVFYKILFYNETNCSEPLTPHTINYFLSAATNF